MFVCFSYVWISGIYIILPWEPSVAQVNHSYSRRLPALGRFKRVTNFFAIKVDPLNLDSQSQANNIPLVVPSSPIKIWGKSVLRFIRYDRAYKQTNRDYNFIYWDIFYVHSFFECIKTAEPIKPKLCKATHVTPRL